MASTAWKSFERWVSSIFTTTRNALSGGNSKMTRSDSLHEKLFISCKYTRHNNKGLRSLMDEERAKAAHEGKTAVCVIGEFDDRANALVVLHIKDLAQFCTEVKDGHVIAKMVPTRTGSKPKRSGTVAD